LGSDNRYYTFLLKHDKYGDLRKEARFIDFASLCNKMFENDEECRKRNLQVRTYAIVLLKRNTGLIEWIKNTDTLKRIVESNWKNHNIKGDMIEIKNKAVQLKVGDTHKPIWHQVKDEVRPILGNVFSERYPSPDFWYEAHLNFTRTTALWSMIGYLIGLGDRHGDNILVHNHTGEVTHVDFDCIFEKGKRLRVPEVVPFRLSANIVDAFGMFREKGPFQRTCEVSLKVLRKNRNNIISFLYSFIYDPLVEHANNIKVEIKEALAVVRTKLSGDVGYGQSLSVEDQVEQVIL